MLTIRDSDSSWQFGKIINIFDGEEKHSAIVLSLKEFHTNALLLKRSQQSLINKELSFEVPKNYYIRTKWG